MSWSNGLNVFLFVGAQYGSKGANHMQWMHSDINHDECMINAIPFSQWKRLKSVIKLNSSLSTPKRESNHYKTMC